MNGPNAVMEVIDNRGDTRYYGEAILMRLTLKFEVNATYQPMDMELILPFDYVLNKTVMKMCTAQLMFVGANMACTERESINASMQYVAK